MIGKKALRTRVLTDAELRAFWQAAEATPYPYGPLFRMLALTGQRKSEVAEARWCEFDLAKKRWVVAAERMKSDAPHVVPLADDVIAILESLPRFKKGDHLFSTDFGVKAVDGFSKAKARLDKAIAAELGKLDPFVIHDVRRSMRTRLSALPIPPDVAELVIAHARPGLRRVYDQYSFEDEKRRALELWAAHLRDIVLPAPANVVKLQPARAEWPSGLNANPPGEKMKCQFFGVGYIGRGGLVSRITYQFSSVLSGLAPISGAAVAIGSRLWNPSTN